MLEYLTNYGQQDISILNLVLSIVIAALIGLVVVEIYKVTHKGLSYDKSFLTTLLLMGPIIAVIITVIGNNIALSIGLVGSLSIIRFRTVIKDSRDLIYLLWGIAIGLGAGTGNWLAIISASVTIAIISLALHHFRYGMKTKRNYVLVVKGKNRELENSVTSLLDTEGFLYQMRSLDLTGDHWQMVLEIEQENGKPADLQNLIKKIENFEEIESTSLLAPNLTLPI